jgi:hypothetical protein
LHALARALPTPFPKRAGTCGRRAVIVHLDGVSRAALRTGMLSGAAPFLCRLLEEGRFRLDPYRVGAPASTAAFQAGLLYGKVDDVPGYLWYDKRRRRKVRMDEGEEVARAEHRHSRGLPGLLAGGTSYTTLFDGSASVPSCNLPRVRSLDWKSNSRHWELPTALALRGVAGAKIWSRLATEALPELTEGILASVKHGRHEWEWRLFCLKLLCGVWLREHATWGTVGDVFHGFPIVYTCLVDYDEVAHRRGPTGELPLEYLKRMDRSVETIVAATEAVPHLNYDVYVLADHGMTDAIPFASIDGRDLPAFLAAAAEGERASARHSSLRALGNRLPPPFGWIAHQAARKEARPPRGVEVVDAGDIAHVYFTDHAEPLPLEAIERLQPRILAALQTSAAVPFVVARSIAGPVVLAGREYHRLAEPRQRAALAAHPAFRGRADVETLFGYLERVISMPSAGDLVLYGNAGPGRTIAFSWEFGSHGGIAADEIESFVVAPRDAAFDFRDVTLPEQLHQWFVRYRPPLPARQDLAEIAHQSEPEREAAIAMASGLALPDPSADAITGCP